MTRTTTDKRRPPRRGRSTTTMRAIGIAGLLGALTLTWIGFNAPNDIPGRQYYTLHARFDNADNLTAHYQVKIGGKLVGQVLHPRVDHGKAVVDLQMDAAVAPLRADTHVVVRPRSAIGVRYVDVVPGTSGAELPEGATIPATQTRATVALDEALSTLDAPRRRRAQELLSALGAGVAGRGDDLNAGLRDADAFAARATSALAAVNARAGATVGLVRGARDAAVAADPVREDIAASFDAGARALRPLQERAPDVRAALERAPAALARLDGGLARGGTLLAAVRRLAVHARPPLDKAPATLAAVTTVLRDARPGVRALRGTLTRADAAVPPTLSLLRDVRPQLPAVDSALDGIKPLVTELGGRMCDVRRMLSNWQEMLAFGVPIDDDRLGGALNTLRLTIIGSAESVAGAGGALRDVMPTRRNSYPRPCEVGGGKG